MPTMKPPKPTPTMIEISWSCKPPNMITPTTTATVIASAAHDIAEIAAEETVAVFRFDAVGEFGADLGDISPCAWSMVALPPFLDPM